VIALVHEKRLHPELSRRAAREDAARDAGADDDEVELAVANPRVARDAASSRVVARGCARGAITAYTQIIPVLVKSNQELHERIVEHDAQIADLEAAVASRDQQIDELRSELSDTVSRLEAVESG
jgi:phage shock protein A